MRLLLGFLMLTPLAMPATAGLQIVDLGSGEAFGLNDAGTVVGRTASNQAFEWTGGLRSEVSGPNTFAGRGIDVNDAGEMVGAMHTFSRPEGEAFVQTDTGIVLVGPPNFGSQGNGINNNRQIAGQYGSQRGFVWQDGIAQDIGTFGGTRSGAADIDSAGRVAGYASRANSDARAMLLIPEDTDNDGLADLWFRDSNNDQVNDLMLDLGTLGGPTSVATAMNNVGVVVGNADAIGGRNGFIWTEAAGMQDLGHEVFPNAINDAGLAVGFYRDGNGQSRAFRGTASGYIDLNNMLPEDSGWVLEEAHGINANGWIVGSGLLNGQGHAFLLVPEPATLMLLGLAVVAVGRRRA